MKQRKALLKKSQVYLILNRENNAEYIDRLYPRLLNSGIDIIQLRDKKGEKKDLLKLAKKISAFFLKSKTLFIVNDYPDIAIESGADGLHLGQDDLSFVEARKILGKNKIIGLSCHSIEQAREAQELGADYIGIGPIYATVTKPEYKPIGLEALCRLKGQIKIPYFAIGDIHHGNIKGVILSGSRRAAFCRAILNSPDPAKSALQLKEILKNDAA